jgi:hypothetical protein
MYYNALGDIVVPRRGECFVIKESYKVALPPTSGFIKQDRWHGS